MLNMAIIADDLTGACDAGIQLKKLGCNIKVIVNPRECKALKDNLSGAVSVNTNTRSVEPEQSARIVGELLGYLQKSGVSFFYKKIDSVMRGNIGKEIDACLKRLPAEFALVAPAFPENGRTIQGGILRIDVYNGSPKYINAVDAICGTTERKCAVIPISTVQRGSKAVIAELERRLGDGTTIFLIDTCDKSDFSIITEAASYFGPRCLPVGSAGWIHYLQEILPANCEDSPEPDNAYSLSESDHVLLAIGSRHPATILQIQELKSTDKFSYYLIPTDDLDDSAMKRQVRRLARQMEDDVRQGAVRRGILITTESIFNGTESNTPELFYQDIVNSTIVTAIAELVEHAMRLLPVGGLIISGGDVANGVLERLGVGQIQLMDEPFRGVAAGRIECAQPCLLATKSGGFGGKDALLYLYYYLCDARY